jgi:hypothetical protein
MFLLSKTGVKSAWIILLYKWKKELILSISLLMKYSEYQNLNFSLINAVHIAIFKWVYFNMFHFLCE